MTTPESPFDEARRSLEQPLRFVCRGGVAHLERVRGLDETLRAAARRAREAAATDTLRRLMDAVLAALPDPGLPPAERLGRLERCLALVAQSHSPPAASGAPPVGPAPTPTSRRVAPRSRAGSSPGASRPTGARTASGSRPKVGPRELASGAPSVGPRPVPGTPSPPPSRSPFPPPPVALDADVQQVKGVGARLGELLRRRDLATVEDLLRFLPRRYEDRRASFAVRDLRPGVSATVEVEVLSRSYKAFRGRRQLDVLVGDDTGVLQLRWFRVPGRGFAERFAKGARVRVSGMVKVFHGRFEMAHPEVGPAAGDITDSIVPFYAEVEGIRPQQMRRIVAAALPAARGLEDALPAHLRAARALPHLAEAVTTLHAPPGGADLGALAAMATPWHRRLIYEELLLLQLGVLRRKAEVQLERGRPLEVGASLAATATRLFAFALTGAQRRALADVEADLRRPTPMQRLLQGDVGSGKTAVALTAAAAAVAGGCQAAIMAPTEILAEQHARVALKTLTPAGVRVELLTAAAGAAERRRIIGQLADGHIQVAIGTHALIQEDVTFKALGLAIVDEQHRFGVAQRAALLEKGRAALGALPHTLVMTATPIPRTLALTLYGDLDLSVIDELPPGRTPIRTMLFRAAERAQAYERVRHAVALGRQAYVVYPLVSESEAEGMEEVRDATSAAEELAAGPFAGLAVGLLHGRMPPDDKDRVMRAFSRGEVAVLVATTVVEVGIDVPNATVMVVEHAERFGLSQLHQLRGRVGRGARASECLLVVHKLPSEEAWRRLAVMEETHDGFRIALEDLRLRGPGDFVGTRQSGLPLLTFADLARDEELLVLAREDAAAVLRDDPTLSRPEHQGLAEAWRRFGARGLTLA